MARTYLSADNSRGNPVTANNPSFAHLRGWNAGVRVEADTRGARDAFLVYMTSGSNGGDGRLLGKVTDTPDGPHWEPSSHTCTVCSGALEPSDYGGYVHSDDSDDTHTPVSPRAQA